MEKQLYGTRLYINLLKLEHNLNYIKKYYKNVRIIAMVKANAYGHGDVMITKKMEQLGINCFGVADFEEGLLLRKNGIKSSIIVMNPGINNLQTIIEKKIEPVIYSHDLLNKLIGMLNTVFSKRRLIPIHIKINTGMNRWGFIPSEIPGLISIIKKNKQLKIISIYSHLASVQNKGDDIFTKKQILDLTKSNLLFLNSFNCKIPSHIFDSRGLVHFSEPLTQYNYYRLGILLYGGIKHSTLEPISELRCPVYQIRTINHKDSIGYNRRFIAKQKMKIGIIPFGYADGLQRSWGNGILKFYYKGIFLPTLGDISMDSCVVDLSGVKDINVGDDILYFGLERPIWDLANDLQTIPYEIMATLSRRIRRIYC